MIKCAVQHAEAMVREAEDCARLTVTMDLITDPDFTDKEFSEQFLSFLSLLSGLCEAHGDVPTPGTHNASCHAPCLGKCM